MLRAGQTGPAGQAKALEEQLAAQRAERERFSTAMESLAEVVHRCKGRLK